MTAYFSGDDGIFTDGLTQRGAYFRRKRFTQAFV